MDPFSEAKVIVAMAESAYVEELRDSLRDAYFNLSVDERIKLFANIILDGQVSRLEDLIMAIEPLVEELSLVENTIVIAYFLGREAGAGE